MIGPKIRNRFRRPVIACLVITLMLTSSLLPFFADSAAAGVTRASFLDISGHPDEPLIIRLAGMGIVGGYGDGLFGPDDPVTREQFAKMLVLSAGIEIDAGAADLAFEDCAEVSGWARPYVGVAVRRGLVNGVGNNLFAPAANVTRAQALTMIARALVGDASLAALREAPFAAGFSDDSLVPDWAQPAIALAVREGIVGRSDYSSLEPDKDSTRAMCSRYLSRFIDRLGWSDAASESVTFPAQAGVSYTSQTGLIVDVSAVNLAAETRLEVKTATGPQALDPLLDVYSMYDINLETYSELPEKPQVTLTFPVTEEVDVENVVILHEIDGTWVPATGELALGDKGLTLVTDHLSKYAFSAIVPVGGAVKAPVTMDTTSALDRDGNLVVSTSIASGKGFWRLMDAPWYHLTVEPDPSLISASSPANLLDRTKYLGAMQDNTTFLSPARAQELDLTFYGTGGKAQVHLSAGSEVLPYLAADVVYGLLEHERMPWPLELGDLNEGAKWALSFLEHFKEKASFYFSSGVPFHNKVVKVSRWLVSQVEEWWIEDKVNDAIGSFTPSSVELAYGMGTAALNWLVYSTLGWDKAQYEVIAVSEALTLKIEPASAHVTPLGTTKFEVTARDQAGNSLSVGPVAWSVTGGGTVTADGLFAADARAKGDFSVAVSMGNPLSSSTPYKATAEVTVEVDDSLGSLSGTVYDDSSPPRGVAGVPLLLQGDVSGDIVKVRVTTGPNGSFFVPGLPPGDYSIYLDNQEERKELPIGVPTPEKQIGWAVDHYWDWERSATWTAAPSQWSVLAGRETRGADIHVVPGPGKISVQVLSADGDPLSGVMVMVYGHAVMRGSEEMGNYVKWGRTDSDGRLTVLNMPCGRYEISCPVVNRYDLDDSQWTPKVVERTLSRAAPILDITIRLEPSGR